MNGLTKSGGLSSWFHAWHNQGLDDLPPDDRRSARLLNIASTISALFATGFGVSYAVYDIANLWPAVMACAILTFGGLMTPVLMVRNFIFTVLWLSGTMLFAFTFIPYTLGAEAWVHTTLNSAYIAGIFLAVGLTRLWLAATLSVVAFSLALVAELTFTGPAWADQMDPTMLTIVKVNMMFANASVIVDSDSGGQLRSEVFHQKYRRLVCVQALKHKSQRDWRH